MINYFMFRRNVNVMLLCVRSNVNDMLLCVRRNVSGLRYIRRNVNRLLCV
jgi:hypothetical protein